MNKETEIWQFAAERLKNNQPVMLLVVAESAGSSPGRQGFKMIVARDELCGSIGGGVMEVKLVERAREYLFPAKAQSGKEKRKDEMTAAIVEQIHRKNAPASSGMICSGRQAVMFFELTPARLETIRKIIEVLKNGDDTFLRITTNGFEVVDTARNKFPAFDFKFERQSENEFVYEEKLGCKNRLFIVGGGHCALALSEIMSKMDFRISLFDDRSDLNTLDKNRFADEKTVIESYENIDEFVKSGANVYVVVMTLGYKFDEIVIRKLFDRDFKYFGVLGSRAKMKTLLRNLGKEGFDKERLNRIRTPVGLSIGSRTPEEIAVSIAAEIIQVKNTIKLRH